MPFKTPDQLGNAVATLMGASGFSFAKSMLWAFESWITNHVSVVEFLLAASAGGWLAGMLTHAMFGRPGAMGWAMAIVGAALATGLGALTAGLIVLPVQDLGLTVLGMMFAFTTPIAAAWLAMMGLVHGVAHHLRRDTTYIT